MKNTKLPLFFKKPVAINPKEHNNCGLYNLADFKFTKDTNSVPVNVDEIIHTAKFYPIVFSKDAPHPIALLGLESSNEFLDKDHQWQKQTYIPSYIRKYPFLLAKSNDNKSFFLCVDQEADNYSDNISDKVNPFFDKDKNPSEFTQSALKFNKIFQKSHEITSNFTKDLIDNKLLTENVAKIKLGNNKILKLDNFLIIDEKKFNALPDDIFLEFRKKGWISVIYNILISSNNWLHLCDIKAKTNK